MDEMQEIIQDFLNESSEILEGLDNKFVELEKAPDDLNLLNEIFRSAHTIKGAAGFLGFKQLVEVAHATENVLNKLRQGELKVNSAIMDIILEAMDFIKLLIGHISNNDQREEDLSGIIGKLNGILQNAECGVRNVDLKSEIQNPKSEIQASVIEPQSVFTPELMNAPSPQSSTQPGINPIKGEEAMIIEPSPAMGEEAIIAAPFSQPEARNPKLETQSVEQTIRVDTKRLDDVLNLVGELVLGRNRLIKLNSLLEGKEWEMTSAFNEVASHIDLITSDLQLAVMKTRMQPVGKVFGKFPRLVRDLARISRKEVELELSGEDTEVDKSVVEEISDPLVHLIRNSIDHGIEPPEIREERGKPRKGTVKLDAYQEGDHIVIVVSDDGKGIDAAAVRAKAIENDLITEADAALMDDKEVLGFIFLPGFSTAKVVTDVSGRGVGMDVVKTNISKLNGVIEIDSRVGLGTRFSLKFPLTMAIIQTLMVGVGNEVFAIPLSNVIEAIRATPTEFHRIEGMEVISRRNAVLPVIRLSERFNIPIESSERSYVVVIAVNGRNYGILVDRLIGQEEVVIKPLDDCAKSAEEVAGATITGDGKVVLILDVAKMVNKLVDERMGKK